MGPRSHVTPLKKKSTPVPLAFQLIFRGTDFQLGFRKNRAPSPYHFWAPSPYHYSGIFGLQNVSIKVAYLKSCKGVYAILIYD